MKYHLSAILVLGLNLFSYHSFAQGMLQHQTFSQGSVDSIDLDTLDVRLAFPIISKPGRGVSTSFAASYHSNFWQIIGTQWFPSAGGGWGGWDVGIGQYDGDFEITSYTQHLCAPANDDHDDLYNYDTSGRVYTDANGIRHTFPGDSTSSDCNDSYTDWPAWAHSLDGYTIDQANNVYDQSGKIVNWGIASDNNGNSLQYKYDSSCSSLGTVYGCYVDTLGTVAVAVIVSPSNPNDISYVYQANVSGPGSTSRTVKAEAITLHYSNYTLQTNFGISGTSEYGPHTISMPSSITYPFGTYTFTYEPTPGYLGSTTGRIASVTLPTGGIIHYNYVGANDSIVSWIDYTLSAVDRVTTDGTIHFVKTEPTSTTATTTVQYPSARTETYNFARVCATGAYVTTGVQKNGVSTAMLYSGTVSFGGTPYSAATDGIYWPITQRQIVTTLDNGYSKMTTEQYNSAGLLSERDETDFAPSSPPLLRKTLVTFYPYTTFTNKYDRVQSTTVLDGSGNQVSQTTYQYDQGSLVPTAGLPNHSPPSTPRGNLTEISTWNSSSPASTIDESFTYDDAGQLRTVVDPGAITTTFTYDSTDAFVTTKALPPLPGASLSLSSVHDPSSGQLLSETDLNGHVTYYYYDDASRLIAKVRDVATGGDGANTTYAYPSSTQTSIIQTIGNGYTTDTEEFVDGYGRAVRAAKKTSATAWTLSDTCYDGDGRTVFESLPYTSTSLTGALVCSASGNLYSYDGNGLLSTVTHASDGTQVQYAHKGRALKVTDEGTGTYHSTRVVQSDGLGRISTVCEYSAGTSQVSSPTPGGCGTDINASGPDASAVGFVTSYSYDLQHRIVSLSQSGQVRSWQYDSLGRLILENAPERGQLPGTSGTASFSYTFNSIGLLTTKTRLAVNQPWGTVSPTSVTASAQEDSLGRPLTVTYSSGSTPSISYTYDSGVASDNPLGALSSVTMGAITEKYGYNSNGQVKWEKSCLASTCSAGTPTYIEQDFLYNHMGQLTSASDGAGNTVSYAYDAYGRTNSVGESLVDSAHPATIMSNFSYGPLGVTGVQYGSNLSGGMNYDSRGRANSFQVQTLASANVYNYSLNWYPNGSLQHAVDSQNDTWSYAYDEFNRITSASKDSGAQGFAYQYDIWGNRWNQKITAGSGYAVSNNFDTHNHIANPLGAGAYFQYDAGGNVLNDGNHQYLYDDENRLVKVDPGTGTEVDYTYGPSGGRVGVNRASGQKDYVYTPDGQLSSVWNLGSPVKANIFLGGRKVASYTTSTFSFEFADWTGTTRVITNAVGGGAATFNSEPFGLLTAPGTASDTVAIAGLDWDSESQTGHAMARQYNPKNGVWNSPDPWNGSYNPGDPQSYNRYTYVQNSPVTYSDPLGLALMADSPDPADSAPTSNSNGLGVGVKVGCQPGDGDVCRGLVVAWNWLRSHISLGSGGCSSICATTSDGFGGLVDGQHMLLLRSRVEMGTGARQQVNQQGLQNQQLKFKTVIRMNTPNFNLWEVNLSLTHNTQIGGWIVQHIVADFGGNQHYEYWEAWPVAANSHVPSIVGFEPLNLTSYSDEFRGSNGTHMRGSARFYEGLALPPSFQRLQNYPSGDLRTTTSDPHLPTENATPAINRWWSVP